MCLFIPVVGISEKKTSIIIMLESKLDIFKMSKIDFYKKVFPDFFVFLNSKHNDLIAKILILCCYDNFF
jgi:hypothetical protein